MSKLTPPLVYDELDMKRAIVETIERCAQVAEDFRKKFKTTLGCDPCVDAALEATAELIRALKDEP
jgi:hypothetical protein